MSATVYGRSEPGILRSSSRPQRRAFTLMELLVVVAIISLLMAVLMPAVQRIESKARAVACQAHLRQWGVGLAMFMDEHHGRPLDATTDAWDRFYRPYCDRPKGVFLCPMARRYETNPNDPILYERQAAGCAIGSKFTAWKLPMRTPASEQDGLLFGSYGFNTAGLYALDIRVNQAGRVARSNVPVLLDCVFLYSQANSGDAPPAYEGELTSPGDIKRWCIDRHGGAINGLFLDWSVQPVGLKELWTLDWSPWFDSQGPWTRTGGVRREDWPRWMREFKDG